MITSPCKHFVAYELVVGALANYHEKRMTITRYRFRPQLQTAWSLLPNSCSGECQQTRCGISHINPARKLNDEATNPHSVGYADLVPSLFFSPKISSIKPFQIGRNAEPSTRSTIFRADLPTVSVSSVRRSMPSSTS
jgi:hypothetical protein